MKKLALLLGSLLVVTATQAKEVVVAPVEAEKEVVVVAEPVVEEAVVVEAAAPALRVTNFGMWTEVDNNAGHADGDFGITYLGINVGLATENWTYGIQSYKAWTLDSEDGVKGVGSRIQFDAWRAFNQESEFKYSLGLRARLNEGYDRYYLRGKYSYGMFSGWADLFYTAQNGHTEWNTKENPLATSNRDSMTAEVMPLNMTFGPLTFGYFLGVSESVESDAPGMNTPGYVEQQLRAYFPLYSYGKFSSNVELRLGLDKNSDAENPKSTTEADYGFGDLQRYQVNMNYDYSENLAFSTYYLYEITKYDTQKRNDYYGEFGFAWDYKF